MGANAPANCRKNLHDLCLDSFRQIEGIRYTFNAEFPSVKLSQTWEWEPKTGQVIYEGKDQGVSR
jgi:hypothetical protein